MGSAPAIELKVKHSDYLKKPMIRDLIFVGGKENAINSIENVEFILKEEYRGQGIGRTSLITEVMAAIELGFGKIVAIAAGPPLVGWKVWPRLGYDAIVPDDIVAKMSAELLADGRVDPAAEVRISMLWDLGLYYLWETHGDGCIMEFDLAPDESWSVRTLLDGLDEEGAL